MRDQSGESSWMMTKLSQHEGMVMIIGIGVSASTMKKEGKESDKRVNLLASQRRTSTSRLCNRLSTNQSGRPLAPSHVMYLMQVLLDGCRNTG